MVMAAYCLVYGVIHFTSPCGLTACTPGSAPGPTLSNEYGKTLPFYYYYYYYFRRTQPTSINVSVQPIYTTDQGLIRPLYQRKMCDVCPALSLKPHFQRPHA